jgi:uncharacterized membrane protein
MVEEIADEDTPLEQIAAGAVTALTLTVGFGLLALGFPYFWVVFPVGFGGVMPVAMGLARLYQQREREPAVASSDEDDAIAMLRDRYARGELTDEAFERQVEKLLETEDVDVPADTTAAEIRERESE